MGIQKTLAMAGGFLMAAPMLSLAETSGAVLYATGFEPEEGFDHRFALSHQGWESEGTGGNGIVWNSFHGKGQQAYIGYFPGVPGEEGLSLWVPVSAEPLTSGVIQIGVLFEIVDSTNGHQDDFRWSLYNADGERLFSLDFDNSALGMNYILDDGEGFVPTEFGFVHGGAYDLILMLNLDRNVWTASINGKVVIPALPITTQEAPLSLGDFSAAWSIRDPSNPGNNYMLFDDLEITLAPLKAIPPVLEMSRAAQGGFSARILGEPGLKYLLEGSQDLKIWLPLKEGFAGPAGILEAEDPTVSLFDHRFYRARQSP